MQRRPDRINPGGAEWVIDQKWAEEMGLTDLEPDSLESASTPGESHRMPTPHHRSSLSLGNDPDSSDDGPDDSSTGIGAEEVDQIVTGHRTPVLAADGGSCRSYLRRCLLYVLVTIVVLSWVSSISG
ncbi:hypothetical protein NP233_g12419 [Leucocoprinus birnbaumii]|uniref:Uncharacterized protein n=1 Tax=Leucocoprinus birnbaumii TaxID=56174 RepID=A0AAD5YQ08_9AGAR|nr:hypothetical protein NP233_g12419 [Leucocoprinus birnbaumii]